MIPILIVIHVLQHYGCVLKLLCIYIIRPKASILKAIKGVFKQRIYMVLNACFVLFFGMFSRMF